MVKFQDLQKLYPNTVYGPTVLYMVSSALPSCPGLIVRATRRAGARFVLNQNGVGIPAYHGSRCEAINAPRRALLQAADHVVYQSRFCWESADRYLAPRKGKATVLYNPIDTSVFTPVARSSPASPLTLLLAGSHCHYYRVETAVRTVSDLVRRGEDVRLAIAGRLVWRDNESVCRRELDAMCSREGVERHVTVSGSYRQSGAVALYQSADLLLHTKYMDPCPRVVVEAMACGLPVVFLRGGGVSELVDASAGVGVDCPKDWDRIHPGERDAWAEAVLRAKRDWPALSRGARKRAVENFDVRAWLDRHRGILEECCG
jgi:glycosyltransferase involved in cell wall biosynthesis